MDLVGEGFADPLRAYTVLAAVALVVLSVAAWLARLSAAWLPIRTWLLIAIRRRAISAGPMLHTPGRYEAVASGALEVEANVEVVMTRSSRSGRRA